MTTPNADEDEKKPDHSHKTGGNIKWYSQTGEERGQLFTELNMCSPCDPDVALLGPHPREMKTPLHTQNYIMLAVHFFVIAPNWEQPGCSSQVND